MKKIITIILIIFCVGTNNAQSISYVSPKKDTLILPNNDLGKIISTTWVDVPKIKRPVIILADEDTIRRKNEVFCNRRKSISLNK